MRVQNKIDRFKGAHLIQKMNDKLIEHKQYIAEYGQGPRRDPQLGVA